MSRKTINQIRVPNIRFEMCLMFISRINGEKVCIPEIEANEIC